MTQKWLKTTIQYAISGDGHATAIKRNYANVVESATDVQMTTFGNAIASLSNDKVESTTINIKQELNV